MKLYQRILKDLFFTRRFYWTLGAFVVLFFISFGISILYPVARILLLIFAGWVLLDYLSLFLPANPLQAERHLPDRFSNGDENEVSITLTNNFPFRINATLIDEVPVQFQWRNFRIKIALPGGAAEKLSYQLRPVERGLYTFHQLHILVSGPLGMICRRISKDQEQQVKVLPSFQLLRQFELKAFSSNLTDSGNKKIRKLGHSLEFEQIKDYVAGDDIRGINWKATARKGQLMVNNYTDERSQQVYCIIDKGRVMKMPFEGMSLLDYAINAALILLRVALIRQDRAGLIALDQEITHFLPADRKTGQMSAILETLYNQQTNFQESDYEKLYATVRTRITTRSLVVLFTNFESMTGLERQLPYLRSIAKNHLLLVVFFENTELRQLTEVDAEEVESLYIRTIAEKFAYEKRLIVKELKQHGIFTILTTPQQLTVNTVNQYLELKARQAI